MKSDLFNIKILPHERTIQAFDNENLAQALIREGILIRSDCGGKGNCQKCKVQTKTKAGRFGKSQLACQMTIHQDIEILIPTASVAAPNIINKPPVQIPKKHLPDNRKPSKEEVCAVAVDLGTTTIGIYLVGLTSEKLLSSLSVKNPQSFFGDDVMTRITRIIEDKIFLSRMQTMVVKAIEWGIKSILKTCGIADRQIKNIIVVGNTTMIHILVKESPSSIGVYPYHPRFTRNRTFETNSLGFLFDHDKKLITMPLITGFLGSDIVSAAISVDLENQPLGTLLIDIGTNGEIMLKGTNTIYAASCATGPAFEGACISNGMLAIPGAIRKVVISKKTLTPDWQMIEDSANKLLKPSGICGSGIISAVSALLKSNIVGFDGRFNFNNRSQNLSKQTPGHFILAESDKTENKRAIKITQKDIRSIQLAKGALSAGITVLCREAGLKRPTKILIAGAFGSFIEIDDMIAIGILPEINKNKIKTIGNAAGAGAILTLFNATGTEKAEQLIQKTKTIDLGSSPNFQETFISSLNFLKFK